MSVADTTFPGAVAPVRPEERIQAVDVLRGFSLLGILLMNIVSFGLPFSAYNDPSNYGGATDANLTFWLTNQVLFEGKMRAIFSMLFGASIIILTSRAEARNAGLELADVYYRRTLWLIAFGVIHAYFIWYGDILFHYGVVGLALFPFRKLSGKALTTIGGALLLIHSLQGLGGMFHFQTVQKTVGEAAVAEKAGNKLTEEQTAAKKEWDDMRKLFKPEKADIDKEIETHRKGFLPNLAHRAGTAASLQSDLFYRYLLLDVAGMLILGMGLMKYGVFDASRSYRFYITMAILGYGVGVPLNWLMGRLWIGSGFDFVTSFGYISATNNLGRFSVAAGHIAILMIVCKAGVLGFVRSALANIGRTALSNYLLTSVICTLIFDGYGFGLFARLQRYQLLYVVGGVWTVCLIFSAVWVRFFRFGPVEWLWRSLTYWTKQPMRLSKPQGPPEQPAAAQASA